MDKGLKNKKIIVFSGQTISSRSLAEAVSADARRLNRRLELMPPAGLGDVWRHIREDVSAMVVIDCVHRHGPSLWHREIRSALDAGIAVLGAGGIGAMRAVEMNPWGMTGVGEVFKRVRNGCIESDDEVLSGQDGFALVALRLALEKALEDALLLPGEAGELLERCRNLYFEKRSWEQVKRLLPGCMAPARLKKMKAFIESGNHDPRLPDAIAAVGRALCNCPPPVKRSDEDSPAAAMLRPKWRLSELYYRSFVLGEAVVPGAEVLKNAKSLRKSWRHGLINDFFVRRWLKEQETEVPSEFTENYVARAMAEKEDAAASFLLANAMTFAEWKRLLEEESMVQWAKQEKKKLLPGFSGGKNCFAEAWAADHGVAAPADSGLSPGQWVLEKGPAGFGLVWEEPVAFMDALRLSGQAAQFAVVSEETEVSYG